MPDVKPWIEQVRRADPPDLWDDIDLRSRGPLQEPRGDRHTLRVAAILIATIVVIGAALFGLQDLGGGPEQPAVGPGQIVRYRLGSPPQPISVGEGAAWVNMGAGSGTTSGIVRIDATTGEQRVLDTPDGDWTAVGGGYAWLVCNSQECGGGSVVRLDPSSGKVIGTTALPARGSQIVGAPDGVWVTTEQGVSFVGADGRVEKSFAIGQPNLVGANQNALWVSGSNVVRSIDPNTGAVLATVNFKDVCTMEVAAGTVWVASCLGQGDRLMGIDAASGDVLFDKRIEGYGQMRYADGTLYLAQWDPKNSEQLQIVAFDSHTGASLGEPMLIPSDPSASQRFPYRAIFPPHVFFAVGEGSLWLTDFSAGEVIRVGIPAPSGKTGRGYWVRLPDAPEAVGGSSNGAVRIAASTNLPEGTLVMINTDRTGECCVAVTDGKIVIQESSSACDKVSGAHALGTSIRIMTTADIGQHIYGVPVGGQPPQQPESVLATLGPHFENLTGDQVVETAGAKSLVASKSYAWPQPLCLEG